MNKELKLEKIENAFDGLKKIHLTFVIKSLWGGATSGTTLQELRNMAIEQALEDWSSPRPFFDWPLFLRRRVFKEIVY